MLIGRKLSVKLLVMGCGFVAVAGASAAGWVDSVQNDPATHSVYLSGWACNPERPNVSGWVHVYIDDTFAGAMRADHIRGDLGVVCKNSYAHGFAGKINYPEATVNKDKRKYEVWMALVMDDGSANVSDIKNRPVIEIGRDPWYPITSSDTCSGGPSGYGWVFARYGGPLYCWNRNRWTSETIYAGVYYYLADPAAPIGAELVVCSTSNLPSGWVEVRSAYGSSECKHPNYIYDRGLSYLIRKIY